MKQETLSMFALVYKVKIDGEEKKCMQTFLEQDEEKMKSDAKKWLENNPEIYDCDLHKIGELKKGVKGHFIEKLKGDNNV